MFPRLLCSLEHGDLVCVDLVIKEGTTLLIQFCLCRIMAVQSATNVDSGVDTITSRLLEVGLDDTDYWQAQLRNHGVKTVASLKHLEGDTETYSTLTEKVRYKVEKKALSQLLNITENEQNDRRKSNEVQKKSRGKLAEVQSQSEIEASDWENKVQKFEIWSRDRPKQIEERLEYVLRIKNEVLSRSPHSNKSWINDYLSHSALQNFLRSVMNSNLPSDSQKHIKSIMQNILKKDELDQIDEHKFFAITELSDWIYNTSNKIVSLCMLKNIADFTTFEDFLKKIVEQINDKEFDSISHEILAKEVAEGINCLRSCYKQKYDDIFILILIHPFLNQYSNDAITLRPLTPTDLDALQKQFSQQRAKITKYEKWLLLLQSYLFLLVIETMRNTKEKEVIDLIKYISQMMQNLKPPLEQKLSQQLLQNLSLADLKQMLLRNMTIPQASKPSSVTSPPPQESLCQSTKPRPVIPRKPASIANPSPLETPKPLQPPIIYSKKEGKHVSQKDPAILLDKSLDPSLDPHVLLKKLGLSHCDSKKLQLQDALCIRPQILELSLKENPIADPSQLPYLVLHKLVSYDSHCRSDLLAEIKSKSVSLHSPDGDFGDCGDPDDDSVFTAEGKSNGIHPLDSLLAILICADDFLRQDLFSRLAKCQLAVPFILPDPLTKKLVIPLWVLRTIINDWGSSGNQQMKQTHSMVRYPMPVVSVIRFGSPQKSGPSKSKILNDIISSDNYDRYFQRNCPGGHYKSVLVDGLVDMCWYLPAGKKGELFPDAITFLNLHGDARDHPHQAKFISQISSMCLVMLHEDDIVFDTNILSKLYSSPGGLTLLNGVGKSHPALRTSFPKAFWVNLTTKTDSQAKDMIQKLSNQD